MVPRIRCEVWERPILHATAIVLRGQPDTGTAQCVRKYNDRGKEAASSVAARRRISDARTTRLEHDRPIVSRLFSRYPIYGQEEEEQNYRASTGEAARER